MSATLNEPACGGSQLWMAPRTIQNHAVSHGRNVLHHRNDQDQFAITSWYVPTCLRAGTLGKIGRFSCKGREGIPSSHKLGNKQATILGVMQIDLRWEKVLHM